MILRALYSLGKYLLGGTFIAGLTMAILWLAIRDIPKPPPAAALLHEQLCEDEYSEACDPIDEREVVQL